MNTEEIKIPETGKHKPFIVANVREILDAINTDEISFGKGVELFNGVAYKWFSELNKQIESLKEQLAIASEQVPKGAFEYPKTK